MSQGGSYSPSSAARPDPEVAAAPGVAVITGRGVRYRTVSRTQENAPVLLVGGVREIGVTRSPLRLVPIRLQNRVTDRGSVRNNRYGHRLDCDARAPLARSFQFRPLRSARLPDLPYVFDTGGNRNLVCVPSLG